MTSQIVSCCRDTCIRRQVEVKDGDDGDEDAGEDDVQDVVERLPLDDQVEGHVLILIIIYVLPARLVSDVPLATLWRSVHILRLSKMMAFTTQTTHRHTTRGFKQKCKQVKTLDYGSNIKQKQA